MVRAQEILSIFDDFLTDPAGILSADAANLGRIGLGNSDLGDPALAYLCDGIADDVSFCKWKSGRS